MADGSGQADIGIFRLNRPVTDAAAAKTRDRLQDVMTCVVGMINLEYLEHGWRDPACTHFVTWKFFFIEHPYVQPRPAQGPRAAGAGRTAANDQGIAARVIHVCPGTGTRGSTVCGCGRGD